MYVISAHHTWLTVGVLKSCFSILGWWHTDICCFLQHGLYRFRIIERIPSAFIWRCTRFRLVSMLWRISAAYILGAPYILLLLKYTWRIACSSRSEAFLRLLTSPSKCLYIRLRAMPNVRLSTCIGYLFTCFSISFNFDSERIWLLLFLGFRAPSLLGPTSSAVCGIQPQLQFLLSQ